MKTIPTFRCPQCRSGLMIIQFDKHGWLCDSCGTFLDYLELASRPPELGPKK